MIGLLRRALLARLLWALLLALAFGGTACRKEECESGRKLRENLAHLEVSLRAAQAQPSYLQELCVWIKESENPYLRLSALELINIAEHTHADSVQVEASVRTAARELSDALISEFGIAHNIDAMCSAYLARGYTTATQIYIRDTVNQLRNPVSQSAAKKLMVFGGCGE